MLVPALTVERWSTSEHEIDLSEKSRFPDAELWRRRAKVGEIVHRVVDRQLGSSGRGLGAERHRCVVPVDGVRSGRDYRLDQPRDLAIDVIPEPVFAGRQGEKRGHDSDAMITPDPNVHARRMILWFLDDNHGHLPGKAGEQVLRPLPDKSPAQV